MGKTWKEFGRKKVVVRKAGKKATNIKFVPFIPKSNQVVRRNKHEFENLGLEVEWTNGKVIINGQVFNSFNDLRVPDRVVSKHLNIPLPEPNARFYERNGVRYYVFDKIGVAVKSCMSYWDSEVQPPENLFGAATEELKMAYLQSQKEKRWRRNVQKAVSKAIKIVAKQNGIDLLPENLPVSHALIEELEQAGFQVRVKA